MRVVVRTYYVFSGSNVSKLAGEWWFVGESWGDDNEQWVHLPLLVCTRVYNVVVYRGTGTWVQVGRYFGGTAQGDRRF